MGQKNRQTEKMQVKDRNTKRCVLAAVVADFRGDGAGIATAAEEGKQSSLRGSEPFWAMPTRAMRLYRPALIREC